MMRRSLVSCCNFKFSLQSNFLVILHTCHLSYMHVRTQGTVCQRSKRSRTQGTERFQEPLRGKPGGFGFASGHGAWNRLMLEMTGGAVPVPLKRRMMQLAVVACR